MRFFTLLKFLWDDLVYDAVRSGMTVINLAAVLVSFFLLAAISTGLGLAGRQNSPENVILVLEKNTIDPMQSRLEAEALQAIASLGDGHVNRVFPFTFHHLDIDDHLVQVRGVPPEEFSRTFELEIQQGRLPAAPDEVAISEGAVHFAAWGVGDTLTIYGSEFHVSGIVQMPESTFATVWMSLETAENTFHSGGAYQGAVVVIPAGTNPDEVLFMIESLPNLNNRYAAFLMDDVYFRFAHALENARIISLALTWIALFRITFGVYHTIQLNLEERGRELILLHAAGLCIGDLQKILLARVVFLAVISYFLGWAAAAVIIDRFERISPIVLHGEHIPVLLDPHMLVAGFSLMLLFCILGVWLPTRKISTAGVLNLSGD